MLKIKIIYFTALFAIALFIFGYSGVNAATLKINSSSSTLNVGETTTLYVVLNSEGVAINNAEANIVFPTQLLDIVSISKSGSIFSLWVEEPYFSNTTGVITLNGGVPTPGFNGSTGPVVSIVVKAKKTGQADLSFSSAAVRANDGLGTDVLSSKQGKILSIVNAVKPIAPEAPTLYTSTEVALQITSPTHPVQNEWYKDSNPIFRWAVPSGVDAIETTIDSNTNGVPHVLYIPTIREKSIKDLRDGIWYFKLRARKDGNWGPISTYVARVDSTVPENKGVTFAYNDKTKILNIHSLITDETSGLNYYEIYINNVLTKKVPSLEFVNGDYNIEYKIAGTNSVKLVAIDYAGNSIESISTFNTTETISPEPVKPVVTADEKLLITVGSFSAPLVYISIIIILLVILFTFIAFSFGRRYGKPHRKFKVQVPLDKGGSIKALSLLKKRLEKHLEILQHTRHNRVLSKEEKEIKEAIEVDLDEVDRAIEEQKMD